jgi:DNA-binding CsgD family transcriptional regulator
VYLNGQRLDLLRRVMGLLAESHGELEVRTLVGGLMLDLLGAQYYASYVWDDDHKRFGSGVRINMDPANLAKYEHHYQYHDPITFKLQQHRFAVRVSNVMPQEQLVRTEFFNDFVAKDGLYWGANLFAWSNQENIGDLRIWRDKRSGDFSSTEIKLLDLVRPALVGALRRGRKAAGGVQSTGAEKVLSHREREVARLVVRGLHDKEIARQLGISITTVRTHIEHVFRKLHVTSRMALAHKLAAAHGHPHSQG